MGKMGRAVDPQEEQDGTFCPRSVLYAAQTFWILSISHQTKHRHTTRVVFTNDIFGELSSLLSFPASLLFDSSSSFPFSHSSASPEIPLEAVSLRGLYYTAPRLFHTSQHRSDRAIARLTRALKLTREQIGFYPAKTRGFVRGHLSLVECGNRSNGVVTVSCLNALESRGHLVAPDIQDVALHSDVKFILIVEKETVFYRLLDDKFIEKYGPCVLITGRGYPDVATRQLVQKLSQSLAALNPCSTNRTLFAPAVESETTSASKSCCSGPTVGSLPMLVARRGLTRKEPSEEPRPRAIWVACDYDPHGLQIGLTYLLGPEKSIWYLQDLSVRSLRLVPLPTTCDAIQKFGLRTEDIRALSGRDRKLLDTIRTRLCAEPLVSEEWRQQLNHLLHADKGKYELDALSNISDYLGEKTCGATQTLDRTEREISIGSQL